MKSLILIVLTVSLSALAESKLKQTDDLSAALADCKKFEVSSPHPLMPTEMIKMNVHGLENGKCKFTQSFRGNILITCLFTEQNRAELKSNPKNAFMKFMANESICKI